jgi:hypothetical protein
LWLFGSGELFVLYLFRDKLALSHWIAWLYLITLIVNSVTAIAGLLDFLRVRPRVEPAGEITDHFQYAGVIGFIVFVGFLGYYGTTAQIGDPGTNGGIFPEVMSLFTLRSFGVFYSALVLPVVLLLRDRSRRLFLSHGFLSYGFILFITAAAFVYFPLFDFVGRPGGLAYFGAYLGVGLIYLYYFYKLGTGNG